MNHSPSPSRSPANSPQPAFESELVLALSELERVLGHEREALRTLDRRAIEQTANEKMTLDERIAAIVAAGVKPAKEDRSLLERIRAQAIENQRLISHARNCIRGALATVSIVAPESFGPQNGGSKPSSHVAPVRLNVSG